MNIAIVYDSKTGTTAKAAETMSKKLIERGHTCTVKSVSQADVAAVAQADVVCVGSWVEGLFIIAQHPTKASLAFIERLGSLSGKKAVVFCTYKLAPGSTLSKMANALEAKGASVVGQFKYRGPEPDAAFAAFVDSLK